MKLRKSSALMIAFSALISSQALAASNDGFEMLTESGRLARDIYVDRYPAQVEQHLSRAEVVEQLRESIARGEEVVTESGLRKRDIHPNLYPSVTKQSLSREEVVAELQRARRSGELDAHISS